MREGTRVNIFDILVLAGAFLGFGLAAWSALRSGADGPTWELRGRGLEEADRVRILTAARSGATLDDPEEAELAEGYKHRDRRRRAQIEVAAFSPVVVLAALALLRLVSIGFLGLALGLSGVVTSILGYRRGKHMDGTPRVAPSPDADL